MITQMDIIDLEGILEDADAIAAVEVLLKTESLRNLINSIDKTKLSFD